MKSPSKTQIAEGSRPAAVVAFLLFFGLPGIAGEPELLEAVKIDWGDNEFTNLSGVAIVGKFMVVADDESKHSVHVLQGHKNGKFTYFDKIRLAKGNDELDLEGIACDKNTVYVIGSHSRNKDNKRQQAREKVYKFDLDKNGKLVKDSVAETSLRPVIVKHPLLEPASRKKPKEGGVDIEGIAVHNGWLYAGFRGPLDRSHALVLRFRFDKPAESAQLLTVDLGGLGIRDLTRVESGFLILAGPMHDGAGPYQLHHWDGQVGRPSKSRRLCNIPIADGAKAEGLAVLGEDNATYDVFILYDGPQGGDPKRFRVKK